jgi:AcrR family transcriptional regulator
MAARRRAPKKRRTYHHGDLRRALIEASIELIATEGADRFTLREAARRIGVSHAAAYRHFADKANVLEAIAAQGYRELAARLRVAISDVPRADVEKRFARIASTYVRFAVEQEPRFRVMTRPRREELRSPELDDAINEALAVLVGVAREGVESGVLTKAPPIDHAVRVYVLSYGYASLFLLGRLRVRPARVESYFQDLLSPVLASMRAS